MRIFTVPERMAVGYCRLVVVILGNVHHVGHSLDNGRIVMFGSKRVRCADFFMAL